MIGNLERYFRQVKHLCFKDGDGVVRYKDEQIALDNTVPNGYVYLNGPVEFQTEAACIGDKLVRRNLVFIGAFPLAIPEMLFNATVSSLAASNINVEKVTVDKTDIAETEMIDISKFTGVGIIRVEYTVEEMEVYDPNCDFDICKC